MSRLRLYDPSDRDAVLELYRRHWGEGDPARLERYWDWLLACPPNDASTRPLFLVQEWNAHLGGLIACLPRRLVVEGEARDFYWIADFLVEPSRPGSFDAVRLVRGLWPYTADALFGGIPMANTLPLWKRAGLAEHLEVVPAPPEWCIPLRSFPHGDAGLMRRSLQVPRRVPGWLRIRRHLRSDERASKADGLIVSTAGELDHRFEQLSARVAATGGVHLTRDTDYLTWRFLRCPHRDHDVITAETPNGTLQGYAVLAGPHQRTGSPDGLVLDLLVAPGDGEAARHLIAESARRSAVRGAADLTVIGALPVDLPSTLQGMGARRGPGGRKPLVIHARAVSGAQRGLLSHPAALQLPGELGASLSDF